MESTWWVLVGVQENSTYDSDFKRGSRLSLHVVEMLMEKSFDSVESVFWSEAIITIVIVSIDHSVFCNEIG